MSKKSLVLYYSWSGNTRKIAELIAQKTGADLRELQPENAYLQNYAVQGILQRMWQNSASAAMFCPCWPFRRTEGQMRKGWWISG